MGWKKNNQKRRLKKDKEDPIHFDQTNSLGLLTVFFSAIENDYRVNTTHLGIFAALLHYSIQRGMNPITAFSYQIMPMTKILASSTYHKHIKELSLYGYIRYVPSLKKNKPSSIYIPMEQSNTVRKMELCQECVIFQRWSYRLNDMLAFLVLNALGRYFRYIAKSPAIGAETLLLQLQPSRIACRASNLSFFEDEFLPEQPIKGDFVLIIKKWE